MPKRKRPEEPAEDQFKRFVDTAREYEVDEKDADRKFRKLKPSRQDRPSKDESSQ